MGSKLSLVVLAASIAVASSLQARVHRTGYYHNGDSQGYEAYKQDIGYKSSHKVIIKDETKEENRNIP